MKTILSFKNLFVTLTFALAFVAKAEISENTMELTSVRSVDANVSELSFKHSYRDRNGSAVSQTIKAKDDDGMLSLAAINFSLIQKSSEAIFQKAQSEGYSAAMALWEDVKGKPLARFASVKPAMLVALEKLAAHSSKAIRQLKRDRDRALATGDRAAINELNFRIDLAERENASALSVHEEIKNREALSLKMLSDTVGQLLNQHGPNHMYHVSVDGGAVQTEMLLDKKNPSNALGFFFGSRSPHISDDHLKMSESRGAVEFAANVLQEFETANRVTESLEGHDRRISLDDEFVEAPAEQ